jgi:Zn-dependent peptidase ImmA (M78 family)
MTLDELRKLSDLYRLPIEAFGRPRPRPNGDDAIALQWAFDVAGVRVLDGHDVSEIQAFVGDLRTEEGPRSHEAPAVATLVDTRRQLDPRTVADELRDRLALTSPPVNVHRALAAHDIRVRVVPLRTLSGAFIPESSEHRAGVLVNANQSWCRQRHSAAHELGHLLLGHATRPGSQILSPLGRRMTPRELDAEDFASELLMPAGLVREELRALSASTRSVEGQVCGLASRFLVSFQAMICRLVRLDLLTALDKKRLSRRVRHGDPGGDGGGRGSIAFDAEAFGRM